MSACEEYPRLAARLRGGGYRKCPDFAPTEDLLSQVMRSWCAFCGCRTLRPEFWHPRKQPDRGFIVAACRLCDRAREF